MLTVQHRRDEVREHDHRRDGDNREDARVDERHAVVFVRQHGREVFKSREGDGLGLRREGVVEDRSVGDDVEHRECEDERECEEEGFGAQLFHGASFGVVLRGLFVTDHLYVFECVCC